MNLIDRITSEENIAKAIKSVKSNSGSKTPGVDGVTIDKILQNTEKIITRIQTELRKTKYIPQPVKRIEIPKANGDMRPLGIPTLYDRIVQQSIKQILEPILDKKFHPNSFGFRPQRSAEHALALNNHIVNITKLYFVVDIDIKGFFDNVNHNKLIKQLYKLNIKNKKILSLIKTILKAKIQLPNGKTIDTNKGTPQGGIISPLLANVVLNELDWWIDKQWLGMKLRYPYKHRSHKERAMRESTNLTEVRFVRYADDFKLYCRTRDEAEKLFKLVKKFLKEKLKLDISKSKSRVVNIKKTRSKFLGLEMKAVIKGRKKRICRTWVGQKAKVNIKNKVKREIILLKRNKNPSQVMKFNSVVLGIQNYYRFATMVSLDLYKIGFTINNILMCRIGRCSRKKDFFYIRRYPNYNLQVWNVAGLTLFSLQACRHKVPKMFPKEKRCKKLESTEGTTSKLESKQYNVNWERIRAQVRYLSDSKCGVTGEYIKGNDTFDIHHIKPKAKGGSDEIQNLVLLKPEVHKKLHSKDAHKFYIGNKKYEELLVSLSE